MEITMVMRSETGSLDRLDVGNGWATIRSRSMTNMISKSWAVILPAIRLRMVFGIEP